jgi:hypothetical protein
VPLRRGAIAAEGKKRNVTIGQLKLKLASISPARHLFRLCHKPTCIVIDEFFLDAIRGKGLNGLVVKELPVS